MRYEICDVDGNIHHIEAVDVSYSGRWVAFRGEKDNRLIDVARFLDARYFIEIPSQKPDVPKTIEERLLAAEAKVDYLLNIFDSKNTILKGGW